MTALILFTRTLVEELRTLASKLEHVESVSPTYILGEIAGCIEIAAKRAFHL